MSAGSEVQVVIHHQDRRGLQLIPRVPANPIAGGGDIVYVVADYYNEFAKLLAVLLGFLWLYEDSGVRPPHPRYSVPCSGSIPPPEAGDSNKHLILPITSPPPGLFPEGASRSPGLGLDLDEPVADVPRQRGVEATRLDKLADRLARRVQAEGAVSLRALTLRVLAALGQDGDARGVGVDLLEVRLARCLRRLGPRGLLLASVGLLLLASCGLSSLDRGSEGRCLVCFGHFASPFWLMELVLTSFRDYFTTPALPEQAQFAHQN